jgi:hypothetical protein
MKIPTNIGVRINGKVSKILGLVGVNRNVSLTDAMGRTEDTWKVGNFMLHFLWVIDLLIINHHLF